jgi:hypothetical protein
MTQGSKKLNGDRCRCSPLSGCGEYFNSTAAFDFHRTGTHGVSRRCLSPPEMLGKGMAQKSDGFWVKERMSDAVVAARKAQRAAITDNPPQGDA